MKNRELTCIVCPRGCQLKVGISDDGLVLSVDGNGCTRGITYATDECTDPKRTVTSTVRTESGGVVSVKTSAAVPKKCVFDVMKEINKAKAGADIRIGDVIISDVLGLGVDVVATSNGEGA